MTLTKSTRDFVEDLIKYYISEAASYRSIAEGYSAQTKSISDTALGIIAGCVYSGFLQIYSNQNQKVPLEDIQEFHEIMKEKAPLIKKALEKSKSE